MSSERHTENGPWNDCLELCKPDPLLSLLFEKLGCSFAKPGFIAAALHLALVLVPAGLISWAYPKNVDFLIILTLVISPVWAARVKMKNYKTEALEAEAVRIRKVISDKTAKNSKQKTELIEYLEKRFRLLDREYETWPFSASMVRRLAIASMVPFVTAALSVFLEEIIAG